MYHISEPDHPDSGAQTLRDSDAKRPQLCPKYL